MTGRANHAPDRATGGTRRQFQVVGMRRSGQHAIVTWLARQCPGATFFMNDVEAGQPLEDRLANPDPFDCCYVDGEPVAAPLTRPPDNVIFNHEDLPVDATPECLMTDPGGCRRILVLRDPYNIFASRYFFWVRMPVQALRWKWDDRELWLNHAEHFLAMEGKPGANWVAVNFNRWATDRDYRAALAADLGLEFNDAGYHEVGHVGSSFDSRRYNGSAERMEVERRWLRAAAVPEYLDLVRDESVGSLSRRIFGVPDGVDSLSHGAAARVTPSLIEARQLLDAGRAEEARDMAVHLLHREPKSIDGWFFLAGVNARLNSLDDLIACCRRLIHLQPGHLSAWYNLAVALQSTGNLPEAVDAYQQALAIKPDYAAAHANLGLVLRGLKDYVQAAHHCGEAIRLNPRLAEAHNTQGLIFLELGNHQDAMACFARVLQLQPESATGHCNLGLAHHHLAQWQTAIGHFERALLAQPDFVDARIGLADALRAGGNPEAALENYRQALRQRPTDTAAHGKLGSLLMERGDTGQAMVHFIRAHEIRPGDAEIHNNLATAMMLEGRVEKAIEHYKTALAINPGYASAHWNYSLALLTQGDWDQGWQEYEWRWRVGVSEPRHLPHQEWDGSPMPEGTILLYGEQGFGDAIQFVRFASEVKRRAKKVIVACREDLHRLFSTCPGVDAVCSQDDPVTDFDAHFPLISLARLLKLSPLSIPGQVPYLTAPKEMREDLRAAISPHAGFRVGIAWSGNPQFRWNVHRACLLKDYLPVTGIPGVRVFSLQKGRAALESGSMGSLVDLSAYLGDFSDTASAMMHMDLIITTDTSVAHLAGALGRKVWVLLSAAPDWRWSRDRGECPWYPTMELIRQRQPGNWGEVMQRVAEKLMATVARG